jgi:hypothetical protein
MSVPGSNLLTMAFTVIAQQTISYFKENGRTLNVNGQWVTTYDAPVTIKGSFQPVAKNLYEKYGLDFQKEYFNLYAPNSIVDLDRDVSGDQIVYNSTLFQCQSNTEWFTIDGWKAILCVKLGPAS